MKKFKVTTKVGKNKFQRTFSSVQTVDTYLKGAMDLKKKHPDAEEAEFFVNGTRVTKKFK